ncbi:MULTISPECIES: ArsR/SmtB family transcription factor [Pseudovibrio]|uniref:ArsR/SmtB family transcription factor n=1 Tax=Stappiaceae TaxID=2821832 RepID=UPI002366348E|nr:MULTISPECIES: winged helix-turn-helix domain-containing protein [Pseudovibrio]MDD7911458.1 winged helix-turn-helix domain-containing protein [Pseudovibrio exalbescens]MDX5594223.1 winged helix-turn-helix domain-containing protein [Pseudovibrio sp. SPO723]
MVDLGEALKAINNPVRMDILKWLKEPLENFDVARQQVDAGVEGVCVSLIQERSGLSQSTISSYLATLQRAQLVVSKRIGAWTYYKRDEENIAAFLQQLKRDL